MNGTLYDIEPDEISLEPEHKPGFLVYVIRIIAFLMLVVLLVGLFQNFNKGANIRIVGISDHITRFQVENVNILVSPAFSAKGDSQDDFYLDVKAPVTLPVEGGECFDIVVEAEGYHKWENTICPSISERIYLEIDLVPRDLPPIRQNLFET